MKSGGVTESDLHRKDSFAKVIDFSVETKDFMSRFGTTMPGVQMLKVVRAVSSKIQSI